MPIQNYCGVCLRSVDRAGWCGRAECLARARVRAKRADPMLMPVEKEDLVERHRRGEGNWSAQQLRELAHDRLGDAPVPCKQELIDLCLEQGRRSLTRSTAAAAGRIALSPDLLRCMSGSHLDDVGRKVLVERGGPNDRVLLGPAESDAQYSDRLSWIIFGPSPKPHDRVRLPSEPGGKLSRLQAFRREDVIRDSFLAKRAAHRGAADVLRGALRGLEARDGGSHRVSAA